MPRTMTLTLEITDAELQNFLAKFADRGAMQMDDDDGDTPATGEVDKNGVPWLEAVHASTKTLTKDGTWRGKKGVTPEQRAAAEAAVKSESFTPPAFLAGPAPTAAPAMPSMPAMPTMPPVPVAEPDKPVSYQDIAQKFGDLSNAGKITNEQVLAMYAECDITDPSTLMTNETQRKELFKRLNALG